MSEITKVNQELGQTIVKLAREKFQADNQNAIIGHVTRFQAHIHALKLSKEKTEIEIAYWENVMLQIEQGNFQITNDAKIIVDGKSL